MHNGLIAHFKRGAIFENTLYENGLVHEVNKGWTRRCLVNIGASSQHPCDWINLQKLHRVSILVNNNHYVVPDGHAPWPGASKLILLDLDQGIIFLQLVD